MYRISLILLFGATACATSSQGVKTVPTATTTVASKALNPAGSYAFQSEINGQPVTGTMSLRSENATYVGAIHVEGQGDFPVTSGKVDNRTLTLTFDTPNGTGIAKLEFAMNNDFTGAWELAGQAGPMTGKRTP